MVALKKGIVVDIPPIEEGIKCNRRISCLEERYSSRYSPSRRGYKGSTRNSFFRKGIAIYIAPL
jgi:hypothetical protein